MSVSTRGAAFLRAFFFVAIEESPNRWDVGKSGAESISFSASSQANRGIEKLLRTYGEGFDLTQRADCLQSSQQASGCWGEDSNL